MNILLLGWETSLGAAFLRRAMAARHLVWAMPPDELMRPELIYKSIAESFEEEHADWVVNCAGTNRLQAIGKPPLDEHLLIYNVMPIYWTINAMVALKHPPCRVLSVASQTYRIPQTNTALYCASKAALVMLTKVMARELAEKEWVLNCIAPGKIEDTRMATVTDRQVRDLRGWSEEEANAYALRNVPARRFTTTKEVVEAMFGILALPSYVNGACIDMTGGA